jgi:hypothetical protein
MTQILFLKIIERIITNLTLLKGLQVRYYIVIGSKARWYNYGGMPTAVQKNTAEFVINIQIYYKDQWHTIYTHAIDKIEGIDETFISCLANLASMGVEFYFASVMREIYEQEQAIIREEQIKRDVELAEQEKAEQEKTKQELWENRKWYVKIKDSMRYKSGSFKRSGRIRF